MAVKTSAAPLRMPDPARNIGRVLTFKHSDRRQTYTGIVLGTSDEWTLIRREFDYAEDGYHLLRHKNLTTERGEKERFTEQVLACQWPKGKSVKDMPLSDLGKILAYLTERYGVFSLEERREDMCWLGRLASVDQRILAIHDLDTRGRWNSPGSDVPEVRRGTKGLRYFQPWAIRIIAFDTPYINALKLVESMRRAKNWPRKARA